MISTTVIVIGGGIFLALCIFGTLGVLTLIKLDDIYRLLKLPGTRPGSSTLPEGFEETDATVLRKKLDESVAVQINVRPQKEEHIQSFTQELGEEIIVEDK